MYRSLSVIDSVYPVGSKRWKDLHIFKNKCLTISVVVFLESPIEWNWKGKSKVGEI